MTTNKIKELLDRSQQTFNTVLDDNELPEQGHLVINALKDLAYAIDLIRIQLELE